MCPLCILGPNQKLLRFLHEAVQVGNRPSRYGDVVRGQDFGAGAGGPCADSSQETCPTVRNRSVSGGVVKGDSVKGDQILYQSLPRNLRPVG